jgi:hypothetical protein
MRLNSVRGRRQDGKSGGEVLLDIVAVWKTSSMILELLC